MYSRVTRTVHSAHTSTGTTNFKYSVYCQKWFGYITERSAI